MADPGTFPLGAFCATRVQVAGPDGWFELHRVPAPPCPVSVAGFDRPVQVVTAWNPGGRQRPLADNRRAQTALAAALSTVGASVVPATGVAEAGGWAEPSLAVVGGRRAEVVALARCFAQAAVFEWDPRAGTLAVVSCETGRSVAVSAVEVSGDCDVRARSRGEGAVAGDAA